MFNDTILNPIKWYEKFLLFFCKKRLSVDHSEEGTVWIEYKRLFGKTFITDCNY